MRSISFAIATLTMTTAVVHAQTPPWCRAEGVTQQTGYARDLDNPTLTDVVRLTCWPEDAAKARKAEIDRERAAWSKEMRLTEADWVEVAQFVSMDHRDRDDDEAFRDFRYRSVNAALSPIEQFVVAGKTLGFERHYFADAMGARLSEAGRLGYILACLKSYNLLPSERAMCHPDIARLDRAKLVTEIKTDKNTNLIRRMQIRLALADLEARLPGHEASIKSLIERDGEYGKLFSIAETVREEWEKRWKADIKLFDLLLALDGAVDSGSRKASAGCFGKTWPELQKAISSIPASRFTMESEPGNSFLDKAAPVIVSEPAGYLAAAAFAMCARAENLPDGIAAALGRQLVYNAGFRGPRSAALTAILAAKIELDQRGATIEVPKLQRSWFSAPSGTFSPNEIGIVDKVTTDGDAMTISFPKDMKKNKLCEEYRETRRVVRIRDDGTVEYERKCKKYEVATYNDAPDPQTANARFAAGVEARARVEVESGIVLRVWANAKATVPSHVFGAPVK
jgi:hypothetical protein